MGDLLRVHELSRYVTSHPGQIKQSNWPSFHGVAHGTMSTSLGWKDNHRFGVAQTIVVYPPTGSTAYEREMSTPWSRLRSFGVSPSFTFTFTFTLPDIATKLTFALC